MSRTGCGVMLCSRVYHFGKTFNSLRLFNTLFLRYRTLEEYKQNCDTRKAIKVVWKQNRAVNEYITKSLNARRYCQPKHCIGCKAKVGQPFSSTAITTAFFRFQTKPEFKDHIKSDLYVIQCSRAESRSEIRAQITTNTILLLSVIVVNNNFQLFSAHKLRVCRQKFFFSLTFPQFYCFFGSLFFNYSKQFVSSLLFM